MQKLGKTLITLLCILTMTVTGFAKESEENPQDEEIDYVRNEKIGLVYGYDYESQGLVDINFGQSSDSLDVIVYSMKVEKTDDSYTYELDYKSDENMGLSVFNPPDGDVFFYRVEEGVQEGRHKLFVSLPIADVEQVEEVTFGFLREEGRPHFAYCHTDDEDSFRKNLQVKTEKDVEGVEFTYEIPFTSIEEIPGFSAKTLSRGVLGQDYIYKLEYESNECKSMSFFVPPDGDEFMYVGSNMIKSGKNTLYFAVNQAEVDKAQEITIGFFGESNSRTFIYYRAGTRKIDYSYDYDPANIQETRFGQSDQQGDILVHSMGYEDSKEFRVFEIDYESDQDRDLNVFNPPEGDLFYYQLSGAIKEGRHKIYIYVPLEDVMKVDEITFGFLRGEERPHFTYSFTNSNENGDSHDVRRNSLDILEEDEVTGVNFDKAVDFINSNELDDFKVLGLTRSEVGSDYVYKLDYESDSLRTISFFVPPDGVEFMYVGYNVIKAGTSTLYFKVDSKQVDDAEKITIGFFGEDIERMFIYLDLSEADSHNKSEDFPDPNDLIMDSSYKLKLHGQENQNFVVLTWNNNRKKDGIVGYNLYRYINDDEDTKIRLSDTMLTTNKYFDSDVSINNSYHYICKAVLSDGTELAESNEVVVNVTLTNNPYIYKGKKDQVLLQIGSSSLYNNGKKLVVDDNLNIKPYIKNNRTMVPIRTIAENIEGEVSWNAELRIVTIIYEDKEVSINIDDGTAYVNGELVLMENPPEIREGRTHLPLRFVLESLDLEVNWEQSTQMIQIVY